MVENPVEKDNKKGPAVPRALLMIASGVFVALIFSVYWQINHAYEFLGNGKLDIPEIGGIDKGMGGLEDIMRQMQGQTDNNADPYKIYTTPDGYLSIKYPSSFTDGKKTMEEITGRNLDSTGFLLYTCKIDTSFSDIGLTTMLVTRYDATSTEDVVNQIKKSLNQEQCQSDIEESKTIGNTAYRLFDSTYRCNGRGDMGLWQARVAVVKKNDFEYYTVTGASMVKNWEAAKLDINSIIDSISIGQPAAEATSSNPTVIEENITSQNNETTN